MKPWRYYTSWIDRYSRLALKIAGIGLLIMLFIQILMQFEVIRDILVPTERWEGRPLQDP